MQNTERKYGLTAGISILIMAIAAGFAHGYADAELFSGPLQDILQTLLAHKLLFCGAIAAWVVIFLTDLVVSWSLYEVFRKTSKTASQITALLRFVYTLVLGMAIIQFFRISALLNHAVDPNDLATADAIQFHFRNFTEIWSAGLILFGFHLLGLGYLSMKATFIPRIFGYLLYLAGISYVLVHGGRQLWFINQANVDTMEKILILPMMLGELLLAFWLVFKGLKRESKQVEFVI